MGGPLVWPTVRDWLDTRPSGTFTTTTVANACRLSPRQAAACLRHAIARADKELPGRLEALPKEKPGGVTTWRLTRNLAPLPATFPRVPDDDDEEEPELEVVELEPQPQHELPPLKLDIGSVSNPYIRPIEKPAPAQPADCSHAHIQWLILLIVFIVEAVVVAAAVHWGGW